LDTASIIPYLLYISYENINNPIENLYPIFAVIESYLMRRMITKYGTKSYNGFFNGTLINNRINTEIKLNEFLKKEREPSTLFPSLEELENGFLNSKLTNKQAAGVLYLIESQTRQIGQSTQLKPFNQYQLEHLMPKKWQQYWNTTPLNENQIEKRNSCLLTLGNLAIISEPLNKSILNKIDVIYNELKEHPFTGTGKPEPLKHDLSGLWSWRINQKDRLIYEVIEDVVTVYVLSAMGHYDDK
jgi:Txe/YoeB family toxin of toxin-antitoxin system